MIEINTCSNDDVILQKDRGQKLFFYINILFNLVLNLNLYSLDTKLYHTIPKIYVTEKEDI